MGKANLQLHRKDDWRSGRGHGPLSGIVYEGVSRVGYAQRPRAVFIMALSDCSQHLFFEAPEGPWQDIRRAGAGNTCYEDAYREPAGGGKGAPASAGGSARSCSAESISEPEV